MDTTVLEEGKEIWEDYEEKRKAGFIKAMEFKKKGGKIAGCLCAYTPVEILEAAGMASIGLCGTSQETIPDAEKVLPKTMSTDKVNLWLCTDQEMSLYIFFRHHNR